MSHELISNPNEYLAKPKKEILSCRFGDVYVGSSTPIPRPDTLRLCIILELDENGSFSEHVIKQGTKREAIAQIGGTGDIGDIIEMVDHWDLKRIIKAYKEGCRLANDRPLPNVIERLKQEAKKPPYKVKATG